MNSILHRVLRKLAATSICPHLQISIQQQWELGNEKNLLQTLHWEGKNLGHTSAIDGVGLKIRLLKAIDKP
jgi:hypothetical protein